MGFVRRGGGGGGGDQGGGGDELLGEVHKRCGICRRELHPWEDVCPEDGGSAVMPGELDAGHDDLLARLLADEDADGDDAAAEDDAADDVPDDVPSWPTDNA